MDWAHEMRALRLRQGLKQAALAELIGYDQATVSRWERGTSVPTVAVRKALRAQIEGFDPETSFLQHLFDKVVRSSYSVVLTEPGGFQSAAMSQAAQSYFGMSEEENKGYDWEAHEKTAHQKYIYDYLFRKAQLFSDKTITHVHSKVALRFPDGEVRYNTSNYFPTWTGEAIPRLLIYIEGWEPYTGQDGILVVRRVTDDPQEIRLPNE